MFEFFKKGLSKTIDAMRGAKSEDKISKEILEEMLLEADVGYELVEEILEKLPAKKLVAKDDLKGVLKNYFDYEIAKAADEKPFVELIIGVNGAGKTTTTAKLANLYKNSGQSVILGACDTFRAGAVEQLKKWAQILNLPIVATAQGHDPAAVAFDTVSSASAKNIDRVLIDTAGRLQNQKNLAAELSKIVRICDRAKSGAPHRKIIVLDATQGNHSVAQARAFNEIVRLDGIIITKLDGTPKGGALFAIARELRLPILFVGVGERMEDLAEFNSDEFVETLVDGIYA